MPIPVISLAQMREWERATWSSGQTEAEVIRRVGKRIARRIRKLTRGSDAILFLAGKGNNGNDARAAAEFLDDRKIEFLNVISPATDLRRLEELLRQKFALIVDGIFGIGLNRPLDAHWQKFVSTINDSQIPVLAIDTPSGLNCETGEHFGAAIQAAITLTVGAPKTGLLVQAAWPFVGRLEVLDDVGLVPCPFKSELNWISPDDFENFPPRRAVAAHKGSFGHLAVVAGSFGFHGASVLATRGAQRAQPGLITLLTHENVYGVVAPQLHAPMVNVWKPDLEFPKTTSAILIGPGLHAPGVADEMKPFAQKLWRESDLPIVVDASALDWLPPGDLPANKIRVITPHPGEAARLLNCSTPEIQANRPNAVREISKRFGNCWVILKGHQTLIGRNAGEMFVNSSGNPHLAQGGSGDVLSGLIAGLIAQPPLQTDIGKTLCYAVWQHGAAADELQSSRKNWIIEDLIERLADC
ncbi:MAG TPA: NAD(P)H-hydrate dehydratase [Verrucomicrobiae bacterium]|nr:NAD(P)H-hydrate dehydratase [Verrucomicrobiae bacterium]